LPAIGKQIADKANRAGVAEHGLFPRLLSGACAIIPWGNNTWLGWRIDMARAKPSPAWPTSWRGPFIPCANATQPLLWSNASMVQGAERVRLPPHWPPTGSASIERTRRLGGLRL
jgi:hypothetical protein